MLILLDTVQYGVNFTVTVKNIILIGVLFLFERFSLLGDFSFYDQCFVFLT